MMIAVGAVLLDLAVLGRTGTEGRAAGALEG